MTKKNETSTTDKAMQYEPLLPPVFCFRNCKYLSITEREQDKVEDGKKYPHICERYNKHIKHDGMHPNLPKLKECDYDDSEPREKRFDIPTPQFL